jgi:hypothetical protein
MYSRAESARMQRRALKVPQDPFLYDHDRTGLGKWGRGVRVEIK